MKFLNASQRRGLIALGASFSTSAFAQGGAGFCQISLEYAPLSAAIPSATTAVPGLTMAGVGMISGLIGFALWRNRQNPSLNRLFSTAFLTAAVGLTAVGGGSLIHSVNAAGPYEFNKPDGGTVAGTQLRYADPAPLVTVLNTSGTTLRITANGNAAETGTCVVGKNILDGQSCTTQAFGCTLAPLQLITVVSAPVFSCENDSQSNVVAKYPKFENEDTDYYFYAHSPTIVSDASFDVQGVVVEYVATHQNSNGAEPIYDDYNYLENINELTSGEVEFKFTAPEGYSFDQNYNKVELIQRFPYEACYSQDELPP